MATKKKTQIEKIYGILSRNGKVTRNQAWKMGIIRLGAIVHTLNRRGMNISGEYVTTKSGKDFVYRSL